MLGGAAFDGTILLTHLHWDHVQGLPFFRAGDRDDARVDVFLPDNGDDAVRSLERFMSPPSFPIGPTELRGRWRFATLADGDHEIEGIRVLARSIPHKGGRTLGFRLESAGKSAAYLPDHCLAAEAAPRSAVCDLVEGVDLLIHNAQFLSSEADTAAAYGHSTIDQAVELATSLRVGRLMLFHHAPDRTDAQLDDIVRSIDAGTLPVELAREGMDIEV